MKKIYKTFITLLFIFCIFIIINPNIVNAEDEESIVKVVSIMRKFEYGWTDYKEGDEIHCERGIILGIKCKLDENWYTSGWGYGRKGNTDVYVEADGQVMTVEGDGKPTYVSGDNYLNVDDIYCIYGFEARNAGTGTIKIYVTDSSEEKSITLKVKVRKTAEDTQKEIYDTAYKRDPNKLTNGGERIEYLESVIYNDHINKNDNLWKSFVNQTSPETRKNWYNSIAMFRDTDAVRDILEVLDAYIKVDNATTEQEKNDAMNQFNNAYGNSGKKRGDKYNQLLTKISSRKYRKSKKSDSI